VVLSPLPAERLKTALLGVDRLIAVEENATAQLVALTEREGIFADKKILRYDGRPFTVDELVRRVSGVIA
jgi:2-oxoglutarate ferredoxin oxidoreductase subunit alpha